MPKVIKKANQKRYIIERTIVAEGCLKIITFTYIHYQLTPLSCLNNSTASKSRSRSKPLTTPAPYISES